MDWTSLATWIAGPFAAAVLGWLGRHRIGLANRWIRRRIAAESNLAQCQEELENQAASFARQEAAMARELAARDREREYLKLVISVLSEEAERVLKARHEGLVTTSDASPSAPSPSPASSPSSPTRPTPTPADHS